MISSYPHIDLIIINAKIYDPIKGLLPQTALAISNSKIVYLGDQLDVRSFIKSGPDLIDAKGKLLLPAFSDSHTHFLGFVRRQSELNLENCHSLQEALHVIKKKIEQTEPGGWITGGGWNYNRWPAGERPTRQHLDNLSTRHYIALDSKDWHVCWANSLVLKLANFSLEKPYPGATQLALHPDTGKFTGILEENARMTVFNLIPKWDYTHLRKNYLKTIAKYHQLGFSAIHSVETNDDFKIYQEAYRRQELGLKTFWYMPHQNLLHSENLKGQYGSPEFPLQVAGIKIFVDGTFGSQTAELLENYEGLSHAGVEAMDTETLDLVIKRSVNQKLSCAVHAIGDGAVRKTLWILAKHQRLSKKYGLRHRIEHAQLIQPQDISLFSKNNVYASVQPLHLAGDIPIIGRYLGKRARLSYAFGSLHRSGAELIFGSDIPIEHYNPWHAIYSAMERRYNLDPQEESFFPEECLDLSTCLIAYTVSPAKVVGRGDHFGRIMVGMEADLTILDRDIFNISAEDLKGTESLLTIINGKIVYDRLS
jgi:predicted amidohydrolase YtcJ